MTRQIADPEYNGGGSFYLDDPAHVAGTGIISSNGPTNNATATNGLTDLAQAGDIFVAGIATGGAELIVLDNSGGMQLAGQPDFPNLRLFTFIKLCGDASDAFIRYRISDTGTSSRRSQSGVMTLLRGASMPLNHEWQVGEADREFSELPKEEYRGVEMLMGLIGGSTGRDFDLGPEWTRLGQAVANSSVSHSYIRQVYERPSSPITRQPLSGSIRVFFPGISENQLFRQSLEPTGVRDNAVWMDTSYSPAQVKRKQNDIWKVLS